MLYWLYRDSLQLLVRRDVVTHFLSFGIAIDVGASFFMLFDKCHKI